MALPHEEVDPTGSVRALAVGNTNPLLKEPKPRTYASKRWVFTLHKPSETDIKDLAQLGSKVAGYSIWAEEFGAEGKTPHLQGYFEFLIKRRPMETFSNKRIHWEKAKGSRFDNVAYISKEGGRRWICGKIDESLAGGFPTQESFVGDAMAWLETHPFPKK